MARAASLELRTTLVLSYLLPVCLLLHLLNKKELEVYPIRQFDGYH